MAKQLLFNTSGGIMGGKFLLLHTIANGAVCYTDGVNATGYSKTAGSSTFTTEYFTYSRNVRTATLTWLKACKVKVHSWIGTNEGVITTEEMSFSVGDTYTLVDGTYNGLYYVELA